MELNRATGIDDEEESSNFVRAHTFYDEKEKGSDQSDPITELEEIRKQEEEDDKGEERKTMRVRN